LAAFSLQKKISNLRENHTASTYFAWSPSTSWEPKVGILGLSPPAEGAADFIAAKTRLLQTNKSKKSKKRKDKTHERETGGSSL
jgi:hypothetical protein